MKLIDRNALTDWDSYKNNLIKATAINADEDVAARDKRIKFLKSDFIAFSKYYFPNYFTADFAAFHKKFANKIINNNNNIFVTRSWSRDHAKSVVADLMIPLFLYFNNRLKNFLLVSRTEDNATELLKPLKINLEINQRIINDFGIQCGLNGWEMNKFVTTRNTSFRSIGKGQNPRGIRNEEYRPDGIVFDDIDDDEECRNSKRLDNSWDWLMGALFGCFSISGNKLFIGVGNVIAKDSLLIRASKVSDDHEQIDILTHNQPIDLKRIQQLSKELKAEKDAKKAEVIKMAIDYLKAGSAPSWKERFDILEVCYMIAKMGYRLSQREYFNNPISEGKVFKKDWMQFKKLPSLNNYRNLVAYLDPGFKKTKHSDTKALILVGLLNGEFHIRKTFCGQASINEMIEWCYVMDEFVKSRNSSYRLKMEEVFLQSLLYKDFADIAKAKNKPVPVSGDTRKKPDKNSRIESIAGYFERGQVYWDIDIQNDHHTIASIEQFINFESGITNKEDAAPDAMEGAFFILNNSQCLDPKDISIGSRPIHKHKIN